MARTLADTYPVARETLQEADEVLGLSLSELCFAGPEEVLTDTINAQPALLAASVAALRVLQSEAQVLPRPRFVAGHSMGEYTALVAVGSISYADGLKLVRTRGRLMKEAGERSPGMMAAVLGLDEEAVAAQCTEAATATGGVVQVANDNCPGQIVISGDRTGIERAMALLQEAGARRVVPLAVSIAAHSPLMAPAAAELRAAIEATPVADPMIPLIGNTTAQPLTAADAIRDELVQQLTGSVRWTDSMRHALAADVTTFVEIGPGDVLSGLVRRVDRKSTRMNVNDPAGVETFLAAFAGA